MSNGQLMTRHYFRQASFKRKPDGDGRSDSSAHLLKNLAFISTELQMTKSSAIIQKTGGLCFSSSISFLYVAGEEEIELISERESNALGH